MNSWVMTSSNMSQWPLSAETRQTARKLSAPPGYGCRRQKNGWTPEEHFSCTRFRCFSFPFISTRKCKSKLQFDEGKCGWKVCASPVWTNKVTHTLLFLLQTQPLEQWTNTQPSDLKHNRMDSGRVKVFKVSFWGFSSQTELHQKHRRRRWFKSPPSLKETECIRTHKSRKWLLRLFSYQT